MPKPQNTYMLTKGAGKVAAQADESKKLTSQAKNAQQKDEMLALLKRSRLRERDIDDSIRFLQSWGKGKEPTKTERDKVGKVMEIWVEFAHNVMSTKFAELIADARPIIQLPSVEKLQAGDVAALVSAAIIVRAFVQKAQKVWKALCH